MLSWCLHVSSKSSQRFNNTKYCTSSYLPSLPLSNWEPLVHTGDPECPVSPWAGRPRGSGSPCADSGSVNRADGLWQIHSDWKSFILWDFFFLFFMKPPMHKKSCPSTFRLNIVGLDSLFHGHLGNTLLGFINRKYGFYLLRHLRYDPESFWQYATKTNTIFSARRFCNCLSWYMYLISCLTCSPVVTDDAQHSQLFLTCWMLFHLLSFPGIWSTSAMKKIAYN